MKTVAVVPIKELREAKSRLAGWLSPQQRAALALDMLAHVLHTIEASGAVNNIALISPAANVGHLPPGVILLKQARSGLNNLLEQGREWAISQEADALMVTFADLPLLSPDDLVDIEDLGEREKTVVLAPDRHGHGTNVMLAHPLSLAHFAFGPDSYSKHLAEAWQNGAHVETYISLGTSLDIDTPADLEQMEKERQTFTLLI
ncbi:MAG: 2-phospho-L-lactate guanylyltransferase [Chloroflexi bacterium]|nr:2-phospho-L-lactate guanylyltransferase [Chloroflexota bacterium]